jgi:hypothetical protein
MQIASKAKDPNSVTANPKVRNKKQQKFWNIDWNSSVGRAGLKFLNKKLILEALRRPVLDVLRGEARGFANFPEAPKILFDKKLGRPPFDLGPFGDYWLISDSTKVLFESLQANAFSFLKCDIVLPDGSTGPQYWLCDVSTILDAVDEEKSIVDIIMPGDRELNRVETYKRYKLIFNYNLILNDNIVAGHEIFRLIYSPHYIVCTDNFKKSCKGLSGFKFKNLSN